MINETKFPCKDEKELTKRREAKDEIPDIEEPLPPGAFAGVDYGKAGGDITVIRDPIAAKAAIDMLE